MPLAKQGGIKKTSPHPGISPSSPAGGAPKADERQRPGKPKGIGNNDAHKPK